jgi:hypothetical protein
MDIGVKTNMRRDSKMLCGRTRFLALGAMGSQ